MLSLGGSQVQAEETPATLPFGATILPNGDLCFGTATLRAQSREIAFPAAFVHGISALEVIVARPDGRVHETLLVSTQSAVQLQALLYLSGASNGVRLAGEALPQGQLFDIFIEWQEEGVSRRQPVEHWILDARTGRPLQPSGWVFVGSPIREGRFLAEEEGNLVINYSVGATILDSPDPQSLDDTIHLVNPEVPLPPADQTVTVVLKARKK